MSKIALITGSCGLIGSESTRFLADKGFECIGVDNDMRSYYFGESASTQWNQKRVIVKCGVWEQGQAAFL